MNIQAVLFDIDGTLFTGSDPVPGASDTIRFLQDRHIPYRFISNGTRRARRTVCDKLSRLDVPVSEDQIITPATAAIRYLKERGIQACTLLATGELSEDLLAGGISLVDDAPALVIGDAADRFTYHSMNGAFRQIMNGSLFITLEKDRYWKDTDGLSLGAGAFVAGLEYATGVPPHLIGKPSPDFFRLALMSMDAQPATTLMIGDDLVSDYQGAVNAGLIGVLVMTGKCSPQDLNAVSIPPALVIPSVASIPELFRSG